MSSPDIDVIRCPDCGGVVGATSVTEHGHPCRCFADRPKPKLKPLPIDLAPDPTPGVVDSVIDSVIDSSTLSSPSDEARQTEKLCHACGKNVSGHRRLKDSRGYICLDCAKKEQKETKIKGVKCPKCFRVVKAQTISKLDGQRMCVRCLREARELTKPGSKRFRKIDDKHFEEHSKTQLYVLAGLAAVLAIVILVGWLRS